MSLDNSFNATLASRRRVLLPLSLKRIPRGVWCHASCRPLALLVRNIEGHLTKVTLAGVPGRRVQWSPPFSTEVWAAWTERVQQVAGATPEHLVVRLPEESRRRRFAALLLDQRRQQFGYAKFSLNPTSSVAVAAENLMSANPPKTFWVPTLIDTGAVAGWSYTLARPLPAMPHAPARLTPQSLATLVTEIQHLLAPIGEADNGVPIHGDFGPWNVRRLKDGRIAIIDWEEMTFGPAAADALWHTVTASLVGSSSVGRAVLRSRNSLVGYSRQAVIEAAQFWIDRHLRPEPGEVELSASPRSDSVDLVNRILAALELIVSGN